MRLEFLGSHWNLKFKHKTGMSGRICEASLIPIDVGGHPTTEGGVYNYFGYSRCHPKDNYEKSIGRYVALQDMTKTWHQECRRVFLREVSKHMSLRAPISMPTVTTIQDKLFERIISNLLYPRLEWKYPLRLKTE